MGVIIPILNRNGTSAVIYVDFVCIPLGGYGWIVVLKKVNNKWIKIAKLSRWIS